MKQALFLKVLDKVAISTRNVRAILLVMGTSSILGTISLWNSCQSSWLLKRIELHENQLRWICDIDSAKGKTGNRIIPNSLVNDEEISEYIRAYNYYYKHHYNPDVLNANLLQLHSYKINNIQSVKLPFFGMVFDINDLALITGVCFIVLIGLLIYGLIQKNNNLSECITLLEDESLDADIKKYATSYLISNQILTIKPVKEVLPHFTWFRYAPLVVYSYPLILFGLICGHDFLTSGHGSIISPTNVTFSSIFCGIFGLILISETAILFYIQSLVDKKWRSLSK